MDFDRAFNSENCHRDCACLDLDVLADDTLRDASSSGTSPQEYSESSPQPNLSNAAAKPSSSSKRIRSEGARAQDQLIERMEEGRRDSNENNGRRPDDHLVSAQFNSNVLPNEGPLDVEAKTEASRDIGPGHIVNVGDEANSNRDAENESSAQHAVVELATDGADKVVQRHHMGAVVFSASLLHSFGDGIVVGSTFTINSYDGLM